MTRGGKTQRARPACVLLVLAALVLPACTPSQDSSPPAPTSPPTGSPPPLTLRIPVGKEAPSRIYEAPGQREPQQPRFLVGPGQRFQVRIDNRDRYVHTFILAEADLDLVARQSKTVTVRNVRAPTTPGTYRFYCRYVPATMNGQLVVAADSRTDPPS
jgi:plastocyanin